MKKALIAAVAAIVLLVPLSAQAKPREVCFKWNGQIVCIVLPTKDRPLFVSAGKVVVHDGGGWQT